MPRAKSKTRLPVPSSDVSLSKCGYKLRYADSTRKRALRTASKKYGVLTVLKRINLIRNITKTGTKNKNIMKKDVDYLKKLYIREKKRLVNKKKRKKTKKKKTKGRSKR